MIPDVVQGLPEPTRSSGDIVTTQQDTYRDIYSQAGAGRQVSEVTGNVYRVSSMLVSGRSSSGEVEL